MKIEGLFLEDGKALEDDKTLEHDKTPEGDKTLEGDVLPMSPLEGDEEAFFLYAAHETIGKKGI